MLLVQYAIRNGFDVNQPISDEFAPLTFAISWGCFDVAKYLIENGAAVIQCDQNRNMSEWLLRIMINSHFEYVLENEKGKQIALTKKRENTDVINSDLLNQGKRIKENKN